MPTHNFDPTQFFTTFGLREPVLHVADGDSVNTTTVDSRGYDARREQVATRGNPQTGPFYVDGAEPGDTLAVVLDQIAPNREFGWTTNPVRGNVVDPDFVLELGQQVLAEWKIDRDAQKATLQKADSTLNSFSLPLAPMLGCLGVAPASGQLISAATSAEHGGNLNYNGLVQGVTVYFPVFVAGALLYLGDGHAVQGDGEMGGSGIEVSMDVRFTVHVIKSAPINRVRGEDKEWIFTIGSARPLDQAVQHATTEMLRWLVADYGLDAFSASVLLGQTARYDLGNMCDPAYTMVCKINKNVVRAAQDHPSR